MFLDKIKSLNLGIFRMVDHIHVIGFSKMQYDGYNMETKYFVLSAFIKWGFLNGMLNICNEFS